MNWIRNNISTYIKSVLSTTENLELLISNPTDLDIQFIQHSPGGWSIDKPVTEALLSIIYQNKICRVLEVGAGFSTMVFHFGLSRNNTSYEVFSIEENVDWFKIPTELKDFTDRDAINFQTGRLKFIFGYFGIHASYMIPEKKNLKFGVELVFIDGPQYYFGREGGLDIIYDKLKVGCLIVMDDAERYTEQCVIYKWLKVYKGLELIYLNEHFGDKGLAILRVSEPLTRRFSIDAFSLGMMQGSKRLLNFNAINKKQAYLKSKDFN